MRYLWASRAASFLKTSAFPRAFSSVPGAIDEDKIAEEMKTLFAEHSVHLTPDEKKPSSFDEENMNQEMKSLRDSEMQKLFDDHMEDPDTNMEGKTQLSRTFTMTVPDGRIISGTNVYVADNNDGKNKKLLRTIAWEVDEEGNMIKPLEGNVMLFVDL